MHDVCGDVPYLKGIHAPLVSGMELYTQRTGCELQELIVEDDIILKRRVIPVCHAYFRSFCCPREEWVTQIGVTVLFLLLRNYPRSLLSLVTSTDEYQPSTTGNTGEMRCSDVRPSFQGTYKMERKM